MHNVMKIVGAPLRIKGPARNISCEQLWVRGGHGATGPNLTIHAISGYISSLYLATYGDRTLLLDSGCVCDFDTVRYYATTVLGPRAPVTLCVATHCHPDHMGAVARYRDAKVPTAAPADMCKWYRGAGGRAQWVCDSFLGMVVAYATQRGMRSTYFSPEFTPTHTLRDGTQVPGFEDWVSIHIPGHTSHMVCLFHPSSGILYTSDMLIRHKAQFWSPIPLDLPIYYRHSLKRLRSLRVRFLLLSHGGIIDVEDAGGWQHILDQVLLHTEAPESKRIYMRVINRLMIGYSPEGKASKDGQVFPSLDVMTFGGLCDKTSVMHVK